MIGIYEPLYRPGQLLAERAFLPLRLPENVGVQWREFPIIIEMFRTRVHKRHRLTGLFSPRFRDKTGIAGSEFIRFIEANAGADVYIINPFPQMVYFTYNVWTQGRLSHPGIVEVAQDLLNACGIGWNLADTPRQGRDTMCYSNFWVGSEKFWDDYVGGVLNPIADFLERQPESDVARAVMGDTRYFEPTPFLPFIVERLFSTYLSNERPSIRPYLLDPVASCMNDFERDIVRFLVDHVTQLDRDGAFPTEMKQWMHMLHRLRRRFTNTYYLTRPLPATGKAMSPEAAEAAAGDLASDVFNVPLK